ncbi:MAG TPA: hypothetical protein VHN74_12770 [Candidatus Angelobacter sp.]|jgi:hypothetical protein|nr:hypothetical protein [Candidatus Angelobacter sp.]
MDEHKDRVLGRSRARELTWSEVENISGGQTTSRLTSPSPKHPVGDVLEDAPQ